MEAQINVKDYLSDETMEEIARDVFREQLKISLLKNDGIVADSEMSRFISNISHQFVMEEVQKHIPNVENLIKEKTEKLIAEKDFSYYVFKTKDVWEKEESLAITYIKETTKNAKEIIQKKIMQTIDNHDYAKTISDCIGEEFVAISELLYKIGDRFIIKSKENDDENR